LWTIETLAPTRSELLSGPFTGYSLLPPREMGWLGVSARAFGRRDLSPRADRGPGGRGRRRFLEPAVPVGLAAGEDPLVRPRLLRRAVRPGRGGGVPPDRGAERRRAPRRRGVEPDSRTPVEPLSPARGVRRRPATPVLRGIANRPSAIRGMAYEIKNVKRNRHIVLDSGKEDF